MISRICHGFFSASTSLYLIATAIFLQLFNEAVGFSGLLPSMHWIYMGLGFLAILPLLSNKHLSAFHIPNNTYIIVAVCILALMPLLFDMPLSINAIITLLVNLSFGFVCVCLGAHLVAKLGAEKLLITISWFALVGGLLVVFVELLKYLSHILLGAQWFGGEGDMFAYATQVHCSFYILTMATIGLLYLYAKHNLTITLFFLLLLPLLSAPIVLGSNDVWVYLLAMTLLAIVMQINAIKQRTGSINIRSLVRVVLLLLPLYFVLSWLISWLCGDVLGLEPVLANDVVDIMQFASGIQFAGASVSLLLLAGLALWMRQYSVHLFSLEAWVFVVVFSTLLISSVLNFPLALGSILGLLSFMLGIFQRKV